MGLHRAGEKDGGSGSPQRRTISTRNLAAGTVAGVALFAVPAAPAYASAAWSYYANPEGACRAPGYVAGAVQRTPRLIQNYTKGGVRCGWASYYGWTRGWISSPNGRVAHDSGTYAGQETKSSVSDPSYPGVKNTFHAFGKLRSASFNPYSHLFNASTWRSW